MAKALVGVVLGSRSDFNILRRGLELFRVMGVPYVLEYGSPQKTPQRLIEFAQTAGEDGIEVLVCGAGGSAQVASLLACYTTLPVIGVPIDATPLRGQDALHGMVQQPPGAPVATVGINSGENAALLATEILALKYPQFRAVLSHHRAELRKKMDRSHKELLSEYPDLTDPLRTAPAHNAPRDDESDTQPGSEGETPEPTEASNLKIRPGALYLPQFGSPGQVKPAGKLITTPIPQEPGAVTEDRELLLETEGITTPAPIPPGPQLPPPPTDSDLQPFGVAGIESRTSSEAAPKPSSNPLQEFAQAAAGSNQLPPEIEKDFLLIDTKVFQIDREQGDEDILSHAMLVLLEGGIVAFPTDTVYGLAVDATNAEAVKRLYEVKGQSATHKSLSILIHTQQMLEELVREVPPPIESVLEAFWPGAITIVFAKHPTVLASVSESPSIAIRIPNDPIALKLMELVERPLAVINAAYGDSSAAVDAKQVLDRFDGKIECLLDAGPCRGGKASSVLSVITEPYELLRDGAVPASDLRRLLREKMKG